MTDRLLTDLHPDLRPIAQHFLVSCSARDIKVIITQTFRSSQEQDADYAKGRTEPGPIITNARGGESSHNCTLPDGSPAAKAFDFAIQTENGSLDWDAADPAWQTAIAIGEGLGLVSGSTWHSLKDNPHLELPDWRAAE